MGEIAHTPERNRRIVREYRDAFGSVDQGRYGRLLAATPTSRAGMTRRVGQSAYHQNTGAGRVLYPNGTLRTEATRNLYGMFFEIADGRSASMTELLDNRVAAASFDLAQ